MQKLPRLLILPVLVLAGGLVATPAGAGIESDTDIAETGLIVASDVPSSWTSSPADDTAGAEIDRVAKSTSGCTQYLAARKAVKKSTNAESREFADGSGNTIENEVWVFPSVAKARKAYGLISSTSNTACLDAVFQDLLEQTAGPTVRSIDVAFERQSGLAGIPGDENVAFGGPATATKTDGTIDRVVIGNYVSRVGPAIVSFIASGPPAANGQFIPTFITAADAAIKKTTLRVADAVT